MNSLPELVGPAARIRPGNGVLGSTDSIALYEAPDADALHDALLSLPMFPWLQFTVEPLVTHPQEKDDAGS